MVAFRQLAAWSMLLLIAGCGSKEGSTSTAGGGNTPAVEVQPDGGEWQTFSLPAGGYAVELPGEAKKLPSSEGETSYGVELEQGGAYVVMYSEVGEIKPEEIELRLTNVRNDVVGQQKVLHDATVTVDGHPARDFAFIDADGDAQYYRIAVAHNRLYQVMMVTEKSKFDETKADRERFLASFKLLEPQ